MTQTSTRNSGCCHGAAVECTPKDKAYRARFDIHETDDELVLYGDLPGVLPEDLDIRFENGELSVRGKVTPRHADEQSLRREYGIGDFHRTFSVTENVSVDEISAELKNGVLTLRLPKADEVKPRRIKVQTD